MQLLGAGAAVPAPFGRGTGAVGRSSDGATVPCPVCRRRNDADRLLCRACAAELDTGRPHAVWAGLLEPDSGTAARRGVGARRERTLQLAAAAVVIAAVVGGPLRFLGLGPFAPPARLDAAVLLAAGYPGPAGALAVEVVATTTTVASAAARDVAALNLIDGDAATAWVGAPVDEQGAGEVIDLTLADPAWVTRLEIRNGDHRSSDAYERSDRLLTGVLTLDGGRSYRVDLLDIGLATQVIELPQPELTLRVSLRVEQVFAGTGARGAALSEVTVIGWPAGAADAALARERARTP